jgi:hypothetical protein
MAAGELPEDEVWLSSPRPGAGGDPPRDHLPCPWPRQCPRLWPSQSRTPRLASLAGRPRCAMVLTFKPTVAAVEEAPSKNIRGGWKSSPSIKSWVASCVRTPTRAPRPAAGAGLGHDRWHDGCGAEASEAVWALGHHGLSHGVAIGQHRRPCSADPTSVTSGQTVAERWSRPRGSADDSWP